MACAVFIVSASSELRKRVTYHIRNTQTRTRATRLKTYLEKHINKFANWRRPVGKLHSSHIPSHVFHALEQHFHLEHKKPHMSEGWASRQALLNLDETIFSGPITQYLIYLCALSTFIQALEHNHDASGPIAGSRGL